MDKENKLPNKADRIFFAPVGSDDFKELYVVEDSTMLKYEQSHGDTDDVSWKMSQAEYNFFVENNPYVKALLKDGPIVKANEMLKSIKEDIAMFYKFKPPLNRRERRERAKALKKKIARFKVYCKENNIEIKK